MIRSLSSVYSRRLCNFWLIIGLRYSKISELRLWRSSGSLYEASMEVIFLSLSMYIYVCIISIFM